MGRSTWKSFGSRPLPNRVNIVITENNHSVEGAPHFVAGSIDGALCYIGKRNADRKIFIIGGAKLFNSIISEQKIPIEAMFVSRINRTTNGDTFFLNYSNFRLETFKQRTGFQFLTYYPTSARNNEEVYLDLLRDILTRGSEQMDRTKIGTLNLFGKSLEFDLRESFPLLTTKQMAWRAIQLELFFFLAGKTNTKELEAANVNIWRGNTSREFLDARGLPDYSEGEMGPMYGFQWRSFGGQNIDQLQSIMKELKTNPFSRRLMLTTFNPAQSEAGVLWPCHGIVLQFFCEEEKEKGCLRLSALMYQRSADVFLGLPFNIASYALLVHLVARHVGMIPNKLFISIGSAHIYKTHIEAATEQLKRKPLIAPQLEVLKDISLDDFSELDESYVKLWGYFYHAKISAKMAV